MGEVYRAHDARLQRDVAIKLLPVAFSQDPDRLQRFEQEARAAAALNHPNILSVYDVGAQNESPYIVSELLDGESLRDRLRKGPLPERKAIDYAIQLARGLAAAHAKGIVHRDLKPENVFLTADGRVKILDFGMAKLTEPVSGLSAAPTREAGTAAGVVMGTIGYMAPEQARGRPADPRTDIFSFGAVVYEMSSNRRAFRGDTPADTLSAILNDDPPSLTTTNPAVSLALDRIVRHCLEKEPQQRFQSASDIAFHLGEVNQAPSSPTTALVAGTPRRRKLISTLLALAVLAFVVGATGFVVGRSRADGQPPRIQQVTFRHGLVTSARIAPDGQTIVYAARWDQGQYELYSARLDTQGLRPLGVKADRILAISKTGEVALLQDYTNVTGFAGTGTLAFVPLGGGAPRRAVDDVQYADWSPDGASLAIVRRDHARGVYSLEHPAGNVLYQTAGWISDVRFSHDGKSLAFVDHNVLGDDFGRVATIPTAGGDKKLLGPAWGSIQGLVWNASDTEIWFSASSEGLRRSLHAVSRSGTVRPLMSVPSGLIMQDISSSGRVLVSHAMERRMLMVTAPERQLFGVDGNSNQRITGLQADEVPLRFTPDGRTLYVARVVDLRVQFYRVELQTGSRKLLRDVGPDDLVGVAMVGSPAISPDGRSFGYQFRRTISSLYGIDGLK